MANERVGHDTELLADLSRHPAWPTLRRIVEERKTAEFQRLARDLLTEPGVSEAQRHFARGFFKGVEFLLDTPSRSARAWEKAINESEPNG